MRKQRKLLIASIIFGVLWIGWCFFVMFILGPAIANLQLTTHIISICWVLCVIPLGFFGFYAAALLR